jgi:hypothetical protein
VWLDSTRPRQSVMLMDHPLLVRRLRHFLLPVRLRQKRSSATLGWLQGPQGVRAFPSQVMLERYSSGAKERGRYRHSCGDLLRPGTRSFRDRQGEPQHPRWAHLDCVPVHRSLLSEFPTSVDPPCGDCARLFWVIAVQLLGGRACGN